MQKTTTTPEDFIASLPEEHKKDIATLDNNISEVMQGLPKVMWEGVFWGGSTQKIIGYGNYVAKGKTRTVEWFIVGLSLQKNYISLYVSAVEDNQYLTETYKDRLGKKVKVGKSSISFKSLEDIDMNVLLELIKRARELT
jgi:hypothetical protein